MAECVPEAAGVPVLPGAGAAVGARCFVAERAGAAAAGALMVRREAVEARCCFVAERAALAGVLCFEAT